MLCFFPWSLFAGEELDPLVPLKTGSVHSPINAEGSTTKENRTIKKNEVELEPNKATKEDQQKQNKVEAQKDSNTGPFPSNNEITQPIILDFRIKELMELKKIAREIGGSLVITIEPKGITAADLIIPLRNCGMFNVESKDGKLFIVTSNGEQQKRIYEEEIAALSRRQSALLQNINVLQNLMNTNNQAKSFSSDFSTPMEQDQKINMPPMARNQTDQEEYPLPR
ncbi:hypothetical protein IT6_00870 [Methylacidiphilum caldifontis]|uniref:Uncharacterized protein n=1 Tax=Methylacidiphilum caldifontis TaxID=2795386 RepID=A0A4Y8P841_9BACT|nr:hypothetical protein IT6_00870 [Methylacidiphilum caldifontis]TFE66231.1 hypothetical protein A7Q10_02375 [Methylacidiphilum caldifontis]